jgi:hypothetical protein
MVGFLVVVQHQLEPVEPVEVFRADSQSLCWELIHMIFDEHFTHKSVAFSYPPGARQREQFYPMPEVPDNTIFNKMLAEYK